MRGLGEGLPSPEANADADTMTVVATTSLDGFRTPEKSRATT
jgi:hypothetical protein